MSPVHLDSKQKALTAARTAAETSHNAELARNAAIFEAQRAGASLREIAAATGIPHVTIKRLLERVTRCSCADCSGQIHFGMKLDAETGELVGECDACGTAMRFRKGIWMSRSEPFLDA